MHLTLVIAIIQIARMLLVNVVLVAQLVTEAMAGVMQHAITLHVIMIQIHKAMPTTLRMEAASVSMAITRHFHAD